MKKTDYKFSLDKDFDFVISACKNIKRKGETGTWIEDKYVEAYSNLHKNGYAHSVEIIVDRKIIGGLYGIGIGRIFCGESMFSIEKGASKIAFFELAKFLHKNNFYLIDCQVPNSHLINILGASIIKNNDFTYLLKKYRDDIYKVGAWTELEGEL